MFTVFHQVIHGIIFLAFFSIQFPFSVSSGKNSACSTLCGEYVTQKPSFLSIMDKSADILKSSNAIVKPHPHGETSSRHSAAGFPLTSNPNLRGKAPYECYPQCEEVCLGVYGAYCSHSCGRRSVCKWFNPIYPWDAEWEGWACLNWGCDDVYPGCFFTRCPDYITDLGGGLIGGAA